MKKLLLFTTLLMLITAAVLPVTGCNSKKNNNNSSLLFILGHPVTNITLNKNSTTIPVGITEQLTATIAPANATNQKVSWSSNDQTVATVSSTGIVTAKAVGTAEISVTTHDGDYSAICTVTVSAVVTIPGFATVITISITAIDGTTATGDGDVSNEGTSSVTARGICWSTSPLPTIIALHTTNAGTTGTYTSNLTGLTIDTIYYARAYATNSGGTAYGNEISFNTGKTFGSLFGGGLVFYNDGDGGGLVAATADQGNASWSSAVTLCNGLVRSGYDDWFLPTQYELNLMFLNLQRRSVGNFADDDTKSYWTSTEDVGNPGNAYAQSFAIGIQSSVAESISTNMMVRAIRAF